MEQPTAKSPTPEQPEQVNHRITLAPIQLAGVLVFFTIVLLALAGLFGTTETSKAQSATPLEVQVTYPERLRYKLVYAFNIEVKNTSNEELTGVRVLIDRQYFDRFSDIQITPQPSFITADSYVMDIGTVPPHSIRYVSAQIQAEEYWLHTGSVTVESVHQLVSIPVQTMVYP